MAHENLNLRHLRAFCEVARLGSISAASASVHLSQPAVTQAIAKLERTLGAPLFLRRSSGMTTTEPGIQFLNRAERALGYIRSGTRLARSIGGKVQSPPAFDQMVTSAQLRVLIGVSKASNFSLAARNLGVSQPSLHRLARDLERLSGVTLFAKTTQGIELTPAAQRLAQSAQLAFSELSQGIEEINASQGIDTARIVAGTLPLARTLILPAAINELTRLRPAVQVRVVDGPYQDLLHGLRHGELDVLIGALRDPVPIDDVVQATLFLDELAVFGRKGHPLAGRRDIPVGELTRYPWVAPRPGTPTRAHFDALFHDAGLAPPSALVESSSLVLIRGLLRDSDRLTLLSAHQIRMEEEQGVVQRLGVDLPETARPIGTTVRRDWHPTATQSLFLDLLRRASRRFHE